MKSQKKTTMHKAVEQHKNIETELACNSSQTQKAELIIKANEEIKTEIISPNMHRKLQEISEDYKYVDNIKQEENVEIEFVDVKKEQGVKIECEDYVKGVEHKEYVVEIKHEPIENKYDENYDNPADESYDETVFEKSDESYKEDDVDNEEETYSDNSRSRCKRKVSQDSQLEVRCFYSLPFGLGGICFSFSCNR